VVVGLMAVVEGEHRNSWGLQTFGWLYEC
jgi:hypothetical protein